MPKSKIRKDETEKPEIFPLSEKSAAKLNLKRLTNGGNNGNSNNPIMTTRTNSTVQKINLKFCF